MFLCSTSLLARSVAAGPVLNLALPTAAAIELLPTGNNNNADYIFSRRREGRERGEEIGLKVSRRRCRRVSSFRTWLFSESVAAPRQESA